MNLQPMTPSPYDASGNTFYVFCSCCGKSTRSDEVKCDLDSSWTYYCPPCSTKYIVVITQDNEQARLTCNSMEEAVQARQAFINYGKCQDVTIEKA